MSTQQPAIAIGPVMPGWGSWEWLGVDLQKALSKRYRMVSFAGDQVPECDVAIIVKHALPASVVAALAERSAVIYAPVDFFGTTADIDAADRMLRSCHRIVIHSERLRKCFAPYAPVEYVDHHLKFTRFDAVETEEHREILWVGVRSNLPYLAASLRRNRLPGPLRILTNFEDPERPPSLAQLGLSGIEGLTIEHWTPERHRARLKTAAVALDIKGCEFRQWHKPPAKALDFLASGLPLAMNPEASAVAHLRDRYGFPLCPPTDTDRWFSRAYREETQSLSQRLRADLSLDRIADRWSSIIDDALSDRTSESDSHPEPIRQHFGQRDAPPPAVEGRVRVAVVSVLFEWPTRGGGNVHTFELVNALDRAEYDVHHLIVSHEGWGTGQLKIPLPYSHELLPFGTGDCSLPTLRRRLREAVGRHDPDAVILTDSWNLKPLLADALQSYPTILRLQALECICPLNNVRLLPGPAQCDGNQLTDSLRCKKCLLANSAMSGALHAAERSLSAVGSNAYDEVLRRAFRQAVAVLVVNEETRRLVESSAKRVIVAPSGFDRERFPWPWPETAPQGGRTSLLFAGQVLEPIKGYGVLREACRKLWLQRRDFELVATGLPLADAEPFERFIGWRSQAELPEILRSAEICVVPSIAQEALGRVAVEAQAVGRPVVASRIGGLPTTIAEGESGLLFEPGDAADLAQQLERLLDDPVLRSKLGEGGRRRFEAEFTWETIVERCYRPLLVRRERSPA